MMSQRCSSAKVWNGFLVGIGVWLWMVGTSFGQDKTITEEDIQPIKAKFQSEREEAIKNQFKETSLERADTLAKHAEQALEQKHYKDALRYYREARWQIPYVPSNIPKHVLRVFGNTRMRHADIVNAIALSPDGSKLVSASDDMLVKIWDLANGRELFSYREHKSKVTAVAWSDDGKWIASAGEEGNEIHVWNPEDQKRKWTLKGHTNKVLSLAFRSDNKVLASAGSDRTLRTWNLENGSETTRTQQQGMISCVTYNSNGKLLATVNEDGQLKVYKENPNKPVEKEAKKEVKKDEKSPLKTPPALVEVITQPAHSFKGRQVAFAADGKSIYSAGEDRMIKQYGAPESDGTSTAGMGSRLKIFDSSNGGHVSPVTSLAISSDGKTFVSGGSGSDLGIRIWDIPTGKVVRTLQGHTAEVTSLAFSKTGNVLVSASADQNIRVWYLESTDPHRNFADAKDYLWSAVFSRDGTLFATAGRDRMIRIYDYTTGQLKQSLPGHSSPVTALVFDPKNEVLASASGDKSIKLWDVKTGQIKKELTGHTSAVMCLCFNAEGSQLFSGSVDKTLKVWNIASAKVLQSIDIKSPVSSVMYSKDNKLLFAGSSDGQLRLFDTGANLTEKSQMTAHLGGVACIAIGPNNRIATCGGDRLVKIWNVANNNLTIVGDLKGHSNSVTSVAFSSDGRLLVSGGGDLLLKIWNGQNLTEMRSLRGHTDWITSVLFSPDNKYILSASVDKTSRIWELLTEEVAAPVGHTRKVSVLAVSADSKWVASAGEDKVIKVWEIETGFESFSLAAHSDEITAMTFSPKKDRLISSGKDKKLRFWDMNTKKEALTLPRDNSPSMLYTKNGEKLLVWLYREGIGDNTAITIETFNPEGKVIGSYSERQRDVSCLSFSSDGEMIVMGGEDGSIRLWDLVNNKRIGVDLVASSKKIMDLSLTPDKKHLISADDSGEVKIWNVEKREAVKTIQAHKLPPDGTMFLAMSPDGTRFASVGSVGDVKLWKTETGEELRSWDMSTLVFNLVFTPDGKNLITANGDTTLYLLELP